MVGQVVVGAGDYIMPGGSKRVTWTVENFAQSDTKLRSDLLSLPEPFSDIMFDLYANRNRFAVIFVVRKDLPESLQVQLRVIGKNAGSFYDLSNVLDKTRVGAIKFMPIAEFIKNWIHENGSLIVECQIFPKNARLCETPRRDILLAKAFDNQCFTDFTLLCEGKEIKIAKAIVGPQSEFFRGMFESNMEESTNGKGEIRNMSFDTLHLLIKYLYSGQIEGQLITREVLIAADYLNIPSVNEIYEQFAPRNFKVDTIVETLLIAQKFDLTTLSEKAFEFLRKSNNVEAAFKNLLAVVEPKPN